MSLHSFSVLFTKSSVVVFIYFRMMGGKRKFRLSVHRKNEERKKKLCKDAKARAIHALSTSVASVSPPNDDAVDSSIQLHQKLLKV